LGERACIYIQLQLDARITLDEVCNWLKENNVAKMKWPEKLVIIDEMPLTPTRKIIKGDLVHFSLG
jgi:non-ribosomal peptide synthetase component E (peptide arylation enzyme)